MPAFYHLSWEPTRRRWWKQYRGKRYVVSCRQLGLPPNQWTKEASSKAANLWWQQTRRQADHDFASTRILVTTEGYQPDPAPEVLSAFLDHVHAHHSPETPTDFSLGHHVTRWLESLSLQAENGELTHAEVKGRTFYVAHFRDWEKLGPNSPVTRITEPLFQDFYLHLLTRVRDGRYGKAYAKKVLKAARDLTAYLISRDLIPPFKQLYDRKHRFTVEVKAVEVFTAGEVRFLYSHADDYTYLFILLALNTGCSQQDVADVHPSEYDPSSGRITRRRSKTGHIASTPTVSYPLWKPTRELLDRLRSSDPERLLLTKTGKPWVDRQTKTSDLVRTRFERLTKRLGITRSFKYLRKTAADLIQSHTHSDTLASLFLAHAPTSLKDRHYTRSDQSGLDEAVRWLGEELGFS